MIDCPNAEMRDRLPDLVHDQLTVTVRAEVTAHVTGCAACAAEVALLRQLHTALRAAPAVDVSKIVAALPAPRRRLSAAVRSRNATWERFDWRVAAAVVALVVGGGSAAVWSRMTSGGGSGTETPVGVQAAAPRLGDPTDSGVQRVAAANLSIDADLGEASVAELDALLRDLDSFDGLPAGEPEPMLPSPSDAEGQR
jgi:anti-sigma factor RsiW